MVERKPFLLRVDPEVMAALRAWASDDLRSLNGQIEFLLRRALRDAGRLPAPRALGEPASRVADDRSRGIARDATGDDPPAALATKKAE